MIERADIEVDLEQLQRLIDRANREGRQGPKFGRTILSGLRAGILWMVQDVIRNRMINANPPYLNRVTGTGVRSVTASPPRGRGTVSQHVAQDWFGSNLDYIRAHELGFRGNVSVRAHAVKSHRRQVWGGGGRSGGKTGQTVTIQAHERRAHTRRVELRARHFFRDTMSAGTGRTRMSVAKSLLVYLRTGRIPSPSEVMGGV